MKRLSELPGCSECLSLLTTLLEPAVRSNKFNEFIVGLGSRLCVSVAHELKNIDLKELFKYFLQFYSMNEDDVTCSEFLQFRNPFLQSFHQYWDRQQIKRQTNQQCPLQIQSTSENGLVSALVNSVFILFFS